MIFFFKSFSYFFYFILHCKQEIKNKKKLKKNKEAKNSNKPGM